MDMSQLPFPVTPGPDDAPPSRVTIGFDQANSDLSSNDRGISEQDLGIALSYESPDFVNDMTLNNLDVWNRMINHEFCIKMANGTASLDGLRYYMIQDQIYLRNSVRTRLGLYYKLSYRDWGTLNQAGLLGTWLGLGLTKDQVEKT